MTRADSLTDRAQVKRKKRKRVPDAMGRIWLEDRGLFDNAVSAAKFPSGVAIHLPCCGRQCS